MSITTSTSDYDRQQLLFETTNFNGDDDIFINSGKFKFFFYNFFCALKRSKKE